MSRIRPVGVTVLAILAAVGAVIAIINTLQMLHLFPIGGPFGQFSFFTFDLFGAILWGILALIYIWVVRMLWNLDPRGWLFVAALSTLNLVLALISIIGQSTWQAMLPSVVVNGLILIYCLLPGTKEAFGTSTEAESPASAGEITAPAEEAIDAKAASAPTAVEVEEVSAAAIAGAVIAAEEYSTAPGMEVAVETEEASTAPAAIAVEAEEVSAALEMEVGAEMVEETSLNKGDKRMVTGNTGVTREIAYVEGIGEVYGGKLNEAGVDTPQALLERGATPQGRKELAAVTGISEHLILKWVGEVDLFRVKGLGSEYSELLKAAGVDTVPELAQRKPENLYNKLIEVNEEFQHVRKMPSQSQVEDWVKQAKEMPRVISY